MPLIPYPRKVDAKVGGRTRPGVDADPGQAGDHRQGPPARAASPGRRTADGGSTREEVAPVPARVPAGTAETRGRLIFSQIALTSRHAKGIFPAPKRLDTADSRRPRPGTTREGPRHAPPARAASADPLAGPPGTTGAAGRDAVAGRAVPAQRDRRAARRVGRVVQRPQPRPSRWTPPPADSATRAGWCRRRPVPPPRGRGCPPRSPPTSRPPPLFTSTPPPPSTCSSAAPTSTPPAQPTTPSPSPAGPRSSSSR